MQKSPRTFWERGLIALVREAGLEPARDCSRQDLNLVRLPISPLTRIFIPGMQNRCEIACDTPLCETSNFYDTPQQPLFYAGFRDFQPCSQLAESGIWCVYPFRHPRACHYRNASCLLEAASETRARKRKREILTDRFALVCICPT